jgi:hypothetical protein
MAVETFLDFFNVIVRRANKSMIFFSINIWRSIKWFLYLILIHGELSNNLVFIIVKEIVEERCLFK